MTVLGDGPAQFENRADAGRRLGGAMVGAYAAPVVVYGLARGGVPVAAEVARALDSPLDALVVRKVGHPQQPEYALGAVTADGPPYLRELRGLDGAAAPLIRARVAAASAEARSMDERLHRDVEALSPEGATCILVDDGLATGATMVAACRWARARGAARVVAAVPVGAGETVRALGAEADEVVCLKAPEDLWAVSIWYRDFGPVGEGDARALLAAQRPAAEAAVARGEAPA